jgi:apolipoprotein D and lipocalin family protein
MKIPVLLLLAVFLLSCREDYKYQLVDKVDLQSFMGDWYVIAILPNPIEKNAVNGIESYEMNDEGEIEITYSFNKGSVDGKRKVMHPKAWVYNTETKAEWRVQFLWPLKFPYLVIWLDEEYETTVIGVPNRKYVWIMSRKPEIKPEKYDEILQHINKLGYKIEDLKKIPQIWE